MSPAQARGAGLMEGSGDGRPAEAPIWWCDEDLAGRIRG